MNKQQIDQFNAASIAEFRGSGGRIASFGAAPLLLLQTTGARTGQRRTNPMMYLADEHEPGTVYAFASAAGADSDPAWYHNLVAHPHDVTVEIGDRTVSAYADTVPEPRRTAAFTEQARRYPGFGRYQKKTERPIPVVALTLHD